MKYMTPAIASLKNGRYQVASVIGAGGFGITYLCLDTKTDKLCAIKEYLPENISSRDIVSKDILPYTDRREEYLHGKKRFCEEAAVLERMRGLPSVVKILDLFEEHNTAYYVMEYIEGKTIKQMIREAGGKLPFQTALSITLRCADVLDMVHRKAGIFHRDISPENIMVMPGLEVRIIDFGSAKTLALTEDQQYSVVLKPGFAPPEQYSSTMSQGSFTDVYALASTFYYMASGQKVPSAPNRMIGAQFQPLCELVPACSVKISDAVQQALLIDQRKRTQTMAEFADGLRGKSRGEQSSGIGWRHRQSPAKQNRPRERRPEKPESDQPLQRKPAAGRDLSRTVTAQPEPLPGERMHPEKALQEKPAVPKAWVLVESGVSAGKLFGLPGDKWISVGRNPARSQIALCGHAEISGIHLYLRYDTARNRFYVIDQSTNGTYCGRYRLQKDRKYEVAPGSRFMIGSRECRILIGESRYAK